MNPTSQKNFKVICRDEPYFRKKFQSNLNPTFQKNFKVIRQDAPYFPKKFKIIRRDEPYFPKKFQSNSSRCTLLLKKKSK